MLERIFGFIIVTIMNVVALLSMMALFVVGMIIMTEASGSLQKTDTLIGFGIMITSVIGIGLTISMFKDNVDILDEEDD